MYHALNDCAYLRSLHDTIPETSLFVYEYLTDNLLGLVQKDLPVSTIKQILRDSLRGLAALHEKDIVHTGTNLVTVWLPPFILKPLQTSNRTTSWSIATPGVIALQSDGLSSPTSRMPCMYRPTKRSLADTLATGCGAVPKPMLRVK